MKLSLKERKLVKEYAKKLQSKRLNEGGVEMNAPDMKGILKIIELEFKENDILRKMKEEPGMDNSLPITIYFDEDENQFAVRFRY